jgi:hypothetical protein
MRRLCRHEYERSVRDLVGVDYDAGSLFSGAAIEAGFDDIGGALAFSAETLEKYVDAAGDITEILRARLSQNIPIPGLEHVDVLIDDDDSKRAMIRTFLRRAFRRKPTLREVEDRLDLILNARHTVTSEHEALLQVVRSALLSPNFLFRPEPHCRDDVERGTARLEAYALATRLSYFIWSTIPDEELLDLAESGSLESLTVLHSQVERLLGDPRSRALADHFAGQWLRFDESAPQPRGVLSGAERCSSSARWEVSEFFADIVTHDRSVFRLIDCDETFVDGTLARMYGIDGGPGLTPSMVHVDVGRRGGILGMAAFLSLTSMPDRTSPVLRGEFVLDRILGRQVGRPPPGVPRLDNGPGSTSSSESGRARLERHVRDASCASCHAEMDAIGFALERFDRDGNWRETDRGAPIDDRGLLPGGGVIEGFAGLKSYLRARRPLFIRSMIMRLFTYAVGRAAESQDVETIDEICAASMRGGDRFSTLVQGVVASRAFRFVSCVPGQGGEGADAK